MFPGFWLQVRPECLLGAGNEGKPHHLTCRFVRPRNGQAPEPRASLKLSFSVVYWKSRRLPASLAHSRHDGAQQACQWEGQKKMRIAIGSDERTHLTDVVVEEVRKRGHEVILFGPLEGRDEPWPLVSQTLAEAVVDGKAEEGILFCWTGTGASIAANKVPGIRAALCRDAQTARGARWWNDANVLVMSLRATSESIAREILDAWFTETLLEDERRFVDQVRDIERKHCPTG